MDIQSLISIYDIEVFAHDWIVVFKAIDTGEYTVIHNDREALLDRILEDEIYVGFNSKYYDQAIIRGIAYGLDNEELKLLNDLIISGDNWWEIDLLEDNKKFFIFQNVDIKNDMQQGLSLKAIEAHLGMNIEESSVDFNITRPLTDEELKMTIEYCKYDVDTTHEIFNLRKDYLSNKIYLGNMIGLSEYQSMAMTNAKLTARLLEAIPNEENTYDEREYEYPSNLKTEYIPDEVFDFFSRLYDESIPSSEVFSSKLDLSIGECNVTIGYGGIHGAIKNYTYRKET